MIIVQQHIITLITRGLNNANQLLVNIIANMTQILVYRIALLIAHTVYLTTQSYTQKLISALAIVF